MGDDIVGVILDTYHDGRRAYMFLANPLGIQMDGVTSEGQDDDYSYDTLWRSEGRVTPRGYMVLFAIPFKSLRFSNQAVQTWGVAVARIVPRSNETVFWPYITRRIAGVGQQMATLEGVTGVSPGRNLQAIPYGSFATARLLDDDGAIVTDTTGRAGIDAKAVIRDAVTVDLTVNPDFSQVESDEPQVTINQRFEVFFPEKRPFFIENASYFETPQNLFFSRRIADPELGARVTTKSRGWAVGALVVNDEEPAAASRRAIRATTSWPAWAWCACSASSRASRTWAGSSRTGSSAPRRTACTASTAAGSSTTTGRDGAVGRQLDDGGRRPGEHWLVNLRRRLARGTRVRLLRQFPLAQPGLPADLGSSRAWTCARPSRKWPTRGTRRRAGCWPSGPNWRRTPSGLRGPTPGVDRRARIRDGVPGQTEIGARYWQTFERFEGLEFRRHSTGIYADSEWLHWLSVSLFWRWGTGINYYPAEGLAPFLADYQSAEAGVTLRPTPQLRLDETYLFTRL